MYKRQTLQSGAYMKTYNNPEITWEKTAITDIGLDFSLSVSYTHLDVYKRQAGCHAGTPRWESKPIERGEALMMPIFFDSK